VIVKNKQTQDGIQCSSPSWF